MTIAIGTFVTAVHQYGVIVALPTMGSHFKADLPTIQWVIVTFSLTVSVLLLPMGRLSDMIGRKRMYILGFTILVVGSVIAGFSPDFIVLLVGRVLQGAGSAMILANGTAISVLVFPGDERGKVLGTHLGVVGAGVIAGPAIGGFLVDSLGWRSVFFYNVPVGMLIIALAMFILDQSKLVQETQRGQRPEFDWLGAALCIVTLSIFLLSIASGNQAGWTSIPIMGGILISVILLAIFIWWELRTPSPMLDLRLFKRKLVALGVSVIWIGVMGMQSLLFITPFYLQNILGYSPSDMGLIFIPGAICITLASPISGRFSDRFGARTFKVGGLALSTVALFMLAFGLTVESSIGLILIALILQSCGLGLFLSPTNSSILSSVEPYRYGVVSALMQLSRNLAHVASVALITIIVVVVMAANGFEPSLETVSSEGGQEVARAFVLGLKRACFVLGTLMIVGIAISLPKGQRA